MKCMTCAKQFHAVCKVYEKSTAICVRSFYPMFTTAKPNFCWKCDLCLTNDEENQVATVHEKIDSVADQVNSLSNTLQNSLSNTLQTLVKNLSQEINTKIAEEFNKINASFTGQIESLKTQETLQPGFNQPLGKVWEKREEERLSKVKESRKTLLVKRHPESGAPLDIKILEKAAVDNGIPLNSVNVTDSGDTFVNLPDEASRVKLQPLLTESHPTNEVITVKSKLPTIALLGVTRKYDKDEIVETILKQNEVIRLLVQESSAHLSVVYTKEPSTHSDNPYHQVVMRVSPDVRRAISNHDNKIHMGRVVHKVVNRFYIRRCNTCQCYGHYQDKCPSAQSPICGYCSLSDHISKDCPVKAGPPSGFSCHNCKSRDFETFKGHSTFWHNCPAYKEQQKKLEHSIDYDYSNL